MRLANGDVEGDALRSRECMDPTEDGGLMFEGWIGDTLEEVFGSRMWYWGRFREEFASRVW